MSIKKSRVHVIMRFNHVGENVISVLEWIISAHAFLCTQSLEGADH